MKDIFIKEIRINKVRHLKDLVIPISSEERKHLILTGKNGSGKTSLLEEIKNYITGGQEGLFLTASAIKKLNYIDEAKINDLKSQLEFEKDNQKYLLIISELENLQNGILQRYSRLPNYKIIEIDFNNFDNIQEEYNNGNFVFSYFAALRLTKFDTSKGPLRLELPPVYKISEHANQTFLQYLVNLRTQRSFARDAENYEEIEKINLWFDNFENYLKELFEDQSLKLEFDMNNFDFYLTQNGKEKFHFNTLSDGYSAILNIITEIIMRMENKSSKIYDLQGIVLIDEIETHLHIELQKQVLPFLVKIFPKIQFIVTTHSPFVLNSISNSVIFDLEKEILVSDLSGYSSETIVEGYFSIDKYSNEIKNKVAEYEALVIKKERNEIEESKMTELKRYLYNIPKFMAPELEVKLQQLELENL